MHDFTKYFKEQKGFDRFINELHKKYKSLSKFSGTISLKKLTKEEVKVLSKLFGKKLKENENFAISISKFIKIMENSKYEDFDIKTLVSEYLDIKLITNKEKRNKVRNKEEEFYLKIINNKTDIGNKWLKEVIEKRLSPYQIIHKRYNKDKKSLNIELQNIINLINNLPNEKILISIYSSIYTKDPHYLDLDNNHSSLFLHALSFLDNNKYPTSREDKILLLSKYNIEVDILSNYTITYNLISNKEYINMATKDKEPLLLNIKNILTTEFLDTKNKKVFIFENPSILNEVISKNIDATVIISGGFSNTSVYLILNKLIDNNNKLFYNGDFDPEGLLIAENFKKKYKDNLELFCYTKKDYMTCISENKISTKRLNKLSKINNDKLQEIKELLIKNKVSAYQENNKERLIEFIKETIND